MFYTIRMQDYQLLLVFNSYKKGVLKIYLGRYRFFLMDVRNKVFPNHTPCHYYISDVARKYNTP